MGSQVFKYGDIGNGPEPNDDLDTVTKLFNAEPCPSRGVGAVDSDPLDVGV